MTEINKIEAAVAHLRSEAIARAEKETQTLVDRMIQDLVAVDMDLDKAAPYPKANIDKAAYQQAMTRRSMFLNIARSVKHTRRPSDPFTVEVTNEAINRVLTQAAENAAAEYDAFVAKLIGKIGEVSEAELFGNHVWGNSMLHVTKLDGTKECWKTQMIINISKLGKLFNQFPTRKVKCKA